MLFRIVHCSCFVYRLVLALYDIVFTIACVHGRFLLAFPHILVIHLSPILRIILVFSFNSLFFLLNLVLSYPFILSYPILSYPILSYTILYYTILGAGTLTLNEIEVLLNGKSPAARWEKEEFQRYAGHY